MDDEKDGRVYCHHCNKYKDKRTRFRHLRKLSLELAAAEDNGEGTGTGTMDETTSDSDSSSDHDSTMDSATHLDNEPDDGNEDMELDNNATNGNFPDISNGHFFDFDAKEYLSDAPSTPRSWFNVGTPLPSPPSSPFQLSDDDVSEDEDGYIDLTAEDYREYDRWYAEDSQAEFDEMIVETLTEEDRDSIKMMAIRQFGHISQRNYERIRYSFREKVRLLTLRRLGTRVAELSGIKPVYLDCCIDSCHAFTGKYSGETQCSGCGNPRYDSKGRTRQTFQYIPITPRFQAFFNNPDLMKKLLYRHEYVHSEDAMDDYFDSDGYKDLCDRNIIVDGEDLGEKFFSGMYDIATSILSDGVQIFKEASTENSSCWPIMMQILNLPPAERIKLRNLVPVAIIPGPNQPTDFDSFLVPFVNECLELARGVRTYNAVTGRYFLLRLHPVMVSGDMQAIKHYQQMKGPNAVVPCRGCTSVGCYHAERKTYYIPLARPLEPDSDTGTGTVDSYDPLNLPLRTREKTMNQLARMERAKTWTAHDNLAKKYGLSGPSILDRIPSIDRIKSYPHEFMHLFLLNHGPDLISLWTNTHAGVNNPGRENYVISTADWVAIGRETEAATNLLPAAFIRPLPNIQTSAHLFCAESWSFWITHVGPVVLKGRLKQKYYDHFLELVDIIKCLLRLTNTRDRIKQLRVEIAGYVERFEEYYYQYDYDRLGVCRSTVHALLHVADDVLQCGPPWVPWSFSIERYCREIMACAMSKVVPWATINKFVLQMAQLAAISSKFPDIRRALLFGKGDAPVEVSRMERVYPEYPHTILRCPLVRGFPLKDTVKRRVAAYLRTNNPGCTFHQWLNYIPDRCERWGKVRIGVDGGDCIRSTVAVNPLSAYGKRDNTFVRYQYDKDRNINRPRKEPDMYLATGYGRLDFILALTLPPDPRFGIEEPQLHILAHITEAKDAEGDARTERVSYTQLGRSFVLDITTIQRVVGRVETRGEKATGEWVIIDRNDELCPATFHPEETEHED